ncbi:MAG: CocE/NonD family hydrolase [Lawsonella sp.]|uniref:CocE/NonD family hydrolase n=1 Tax=Lawsonella sp. TaxID=2041415 RepID=UPI002A748ABD|nr:CocE/NonD family hydrolase [Lawsonella sp.]MDY2979262.1 CocE/NonD family hydrolase [Lawsonella sp.]
MAPRIPLTESTQPNTGRPLLRTGHTQQRGRPQPNTGRMLLTGLATVALACGTLPAFAPAAHAAPGTPLGTATADTAAPGAVTSPGGTTSPGLRSTSPGARSANVPSKTGLTFAPASLRNPRSVSWNKHANWTEHYFKTPDGTILHADVLRPKGLADTVKTPIVLSVSPYFNHLADLGIVGLFTEGRMATVLNPTIPNHPTPRFQDFINGTKLLEQGYTWIQVDLRGNGGSTGCLDSDGPGETQDTITAVEWAASQPWSNGRVGLYGKSYDGSTGLIGAAYQPRGLAAVVAQEPGLGSYIYMYNNGVPYYNALGTSISYNEIAASPGRPLRDTPTYMQNSLYEVKHPECLSNNLRLAIDNDRNSPYWRAREFVPKANKSPVPLFVTAGLIEDNTYPDGLVELLHNRLGPTRAWLGMWDHVRGNDVDQHGKLKIGRPGYFAEVMDFYDQYLKDKPAKGYPNIIVQDNTGRWRTQPQWPMPTRTVTFSDGPTGIVKYGSAVSARIAGGGAAMAQADASALNQQKGIWRYYPAQTRDLHISGNMTMRVKTRYFGPTGKYDPMQMRTTLWERMRALLWDGASLAVNVYDVAPNGKTLLLTRGATIVRHGFSDITFQLLPNDWVLRKGHRLAVRLVSTNSEHFMPMKADEPIRVEYSSLRVQVDDGRHQDTYGGVPLYYRVYMNAAGCYPAPNSPCNPRGGSLDDAPTP